MSQREALPVGYVEVQKAWIGEPDSVDVILPKLLHEVTVEVARDYPGYVFQNSRVECTKDGVGIRHYTLYVGYAPAGANKALNPHNMNDAQEPQIGEAHRDFSVGMAEQRFGGGGTDPIDTLKDVP